MHIDHWYSYSETRQNKREKNAIFLFKLSSIPRLRAVANLKELKIEEATPVQSSYGYGEHSIPALP